MKTVSDVLKMIKDKDVKFVDLRFTDTKGKMQHVTADVSTVDEAMFEGYAFDGSSIAGWKGIEASDMYLKPDPASAHVDPFFAQTTVAIFCDVIEPLTGQPYERDPRPIAKKAEAYMASLGIGDKVFFGPEAEFFIFDDVKFSTEHVQGRLQGRQRGAARQLRHRLRDGQPRPPSARQGRLLPGAADRQLPGHPLRDAVGADRDGRRPSRSTTTKSPPPSTSSASSSAP